MSRQLPGARKQSLSPDDLVDGTVLLSFCSAQLLATQQKVPAANLSNDLRPYDMQAVTRHDAERGMRRILKIRAFGRNDDIAEKGILGMHGHGSVDGRNHGHFDIEDVLEDLRALAADLVIPPRREEIEPVR